MSFTRADYEQAVAAIRKQTDVVPAVGLVLGSGLGALVEMLENRHAIPYAEIPGFPLSTVHGHQGSLVFGTWQGQTIVAQQGRTHYYEGYSAQQITFPIRVMHLLGVRSLILTNAAGGLNPAYQVGDLMLFNDHINLIGMAGNNPLIGPNDDALGPRFLSVTNTYDLRLRQTARQIAQDTQMPLHEGVYVVLSGPNFETPAEVRMLRTLGADAVGMSTVHEVLVARHMGMRVLAVSGITNRAIDVIDTPAEASHEEVLEAGKLLVPRLVAIVRGVLRQGV